MLRNIVAVVLTLLILLGSYMAYKKLSYKPERNKKALPKVVKNIDQAVKNTNIPIEITSTGKLVPTRQIILTSEVTGVLRSSKFKEGVAYRKGHNIFVIRQ